MFVHGEVIKSINVGDVQDSEPATLTPDAESTYRGSQPLPPLREGGLHQPVTQVTGLGCCVAMLVKCRAPA